MECFLYSTIFSLKLWKSGITSKINFGLILLIFIYISILDTLRYQILLLLLLFSV